MIQPKIASHVSQKTRRLIQFQALVKVVWKPLTLVFPKIAQENVRKRTKIPSNVSDVQECQIAPLLSVLVSISGK